MPRCTIDSLQEPIVTYPAPIARGIYVLLLSTLLSSGCGDHETGEASDTYQAPTPSPRAGDPFNIEGIFAKKNVLHQYVESAIGSGFELQSITTYSVVTLRKGPTEDTAIYNEKDCITFLSEVSDSTVTFNQGYFDANPYIEYTVALADTPIIGGTFHIDPQVEITGATLTDPWNEDLPTDPEDPRVFDYDNDGDAGYTLKVDGPVKGTLWACGRYYFEMNGTLANPDYISGLVTPLVETSRMQSSSLLIPTDSETYMDDTPENNFFELHRMDENYRCEQLLEDYEEIFAN